MPVNSLIIAHAVHDATWRTWSFEPGVVISLGLLAATYAIGLTRLWRAAGTGSGITRGQAAAFAGGWLALVAALVSPLDVMGGSLFTDHMVSHGMPVGG